MKSLYLPAITGEFSKWRYYQMIMRVENIVEELDYLDTKNKYRVKTADEVDEINSGAVNEMLQRIFDERRLDPIKNYLIKQPDKYVNNLTIAVYSGDPEWFSIDLKALRNIGPEDEEKIDEIEKSFGLIKLRGDEIMFVLDGQHRVKGLREASLLDKSLMEEQIAVTLITHIPDNNGREKTRRLFTTINRYAKPVSLGESILLDEDDLSAILVRDLINEHGFLSKNKVVAQNKTADLKFPSDNDKITSTICLYNINEIFINSKEIYPEYDGPQKNLVRIRPSDDVIKAKKSEIFSYWDLFFELFTSAKKFVESPNNFREENEDLFFLRPIGQEAIFNLIEKLRIDDVINNIYKNKIKQIEGNIDSEFWHFVIYDPYKKKMLTNKSFVKYYLMYHFGLPLTSNQLKSIKDNYKKNSGDLQKDLPSPMFL